ncbi:MAG: HAD-IC family P-type ATPase, partial [Polyangiaceae bacterium]
MSTSPASPAPPDAATETLKSLGLSAPSGLSSVEAKSRLGAQGPNEVPEKRQRPWLRFARKFWGLSAWMIESIVLLSLLLHKYTDVGVALSLLIVNAILSFFQEQRGRSAVTALRSRLQVSARVLRDASWQSVPARELVTGDVVRMRAGDFVPADVKLLDGTLQTDQSALTGESQDVSRAPNETVTAGSTVRHGEGTGVVIATGLRTYFGRTTQLVGTAQPKLHVEEVTSRVVKWLLVIVGVLVAVTLVTALARGIPLVDVLPIVLVLLMSAVPVALPVMFTVSMAIGSMELARRGVLITHLSAIEDAAHMDVLCADKTGTLTMNKLALTGTEAQPGFTAEDVILAGALASNEANADPLDLAFLDAAKARKLLDTQTKTLSFVPFSAKTRCTEAEIAVGDKRSRVVKGALRTIAEMAGLDAPALASLDERAEREAAKGVRVLAVARADGREPLRLVGLAFLYDPPRSDSRSLIDELRSLGIQVKMLTGDAFPVATEMARMLGLGAVMRAPDLRAKPDYPPNAAKIASSGGFAEVFPEDKFLVVKRATAILEIASERRARGFACGCRRRGSRHWRLRACRPASASAH